MVQWRLVPFDLRECSALGKWYALSFSSLLKIWTYPARKNQSLLWDAGFWNAAFAVLFSLACHGKEQ